MKEIHKCGTITEKEGITSLSLLNTSSEAYTKQNVIDVASLKFNEKTDVRKQYSAVALAKNNGNGSSLLWFSTFALSDSLCDTASSGSNFQVFIGALGAQYGMEKPVDIPGVSILTEPLQASGATFPVGMVVAIVVPCVIIAAGAFIVMKRRNR